MALNRYECIGHVGQDAEIKAINGDLKVASFSLAVTEKWKDGNGEQKEKTVWINVNAWRGLASVAEKFFKKGTKLYISGKLDVQTWEDANGGGNRSKTIINLESFEFCGGNQQNYSTSSSSNGHNSPPSGSPAPSSSPPGEDDLPF